MAESVEYRDIPGWPGYRVGSDGSVWSCRRRNRTQPVLTNEWRRRKTHLWSSKGYLSVMLCPGRRLFQVHRLVLLAFVGPCPPGMEACHADGDRTNNRIDNLRWDTHKANQDDMTRHGTWAKGDRCGRARLTSPDVLAIRLEHSRGANLRQLADQFKVTASNIGRIVRRRTWKEVATKKAPPRV